jgi:stress response protein YsnF
MSFDDQPTAHSANQFIGRTVYGPDDEKIGKIGQVYLDDETGRPEFATVGTGLFGTSESFIPLDKAQVIEDKVLVPYDKDMVKDAPHVDPDSGAGHAHLDEAEEERLYQHYGMSYSPPFDRSDPTTAKTIADTPDTTPGVTPGVTPGTTGAGYDTSGPTTDEAMTRSEEHLEAGTRTEERGRARLRKYVTTETETVQVPVSKEHAVLTTEPIDASNIDEATAGPEISEEEHEVVLHEERAVAGTVTEPVERVRLGTETTTDEETVSEEVRKEQIEVEGDVDDKRR